VPSPGPLTRPAASERSLEVLGPREGVRGTCSTTPLCGATSGHPADRRNRRNCSRWQSSWAVDGGPQDADSACAEPGPTSWRKNGRRRRRRRRRPERSGDGWGGGVLVETRDGQRVGGWAAMGCTVDDSPGLCRVAPLGHRHCRPQLHGRRPQSAWQNAPVARLMDARCFKVVNYHSISPIWAVCAICSP
jgi:hypothetical protein